MRRSAAISRTRFFQLHSGSRVDPSGISNAAWNELVYPSRQDRLENFELPALAEVDFGAAQ